MVFYPLQREVSLEDTKVYQLPSLFMSTSLHNLNYSIEIESSKAVATLRRLIKKVAVRHLRQAVATRSGNFYFFNPIDVFYLQGESEEPAEQRITGPVTLLPPPLINQSGMGKVLSQPLGAAHVRMLRRRGRW